MFRYLPEQASEFAPKVDWINNLITDLSLFFTVAIVGAMLYFAWKYRRRNGQDHDTPQIEGSHFLEFLWTAIPTAISIYVATWGIVIYREMRTPHPEAMSINVTGRQWQWRFQYENGKSLDGEAVIPVNKPVKFVLTSSDVLHSFFIPAMRVKSDAVPGQYTKVAFTPVKTGEYEIFCTEYCGKDHSAMISKLRVVSEEEYNRWLNDDSEKIKFTPADAGRALYSSLGCKSCHSMDGSKVVGPSFLNLYGRKGKFTDGKEYSADEQYLRESILQPNLHVVEGFAPNQMPVFEGLVDETQLSNLIAFIKTVDGTVKEAPKLKLGGAKDPSQMTPVERGQLLYSEKACIGCHSLDGVKGVGPSFKGLFGRSEKFTDGSSGVADDAYLKESILKPNAKIVEGYAGGLMPAFEGQLTDEQVADLIEFIKAQK